MIVQNVVGRRQSTDMTFTVGRADLSRARDSCWKSSGPSSATPT